MSSMVWKPVEDGVYEIESPDGSADWKIRVIDDGDEVGQMSSWDRKWEDVGSLSAWGFRLCRQVAAPPLPDGMREAIEYALHTGWDEYNQTLPEALAHRSVLLEWLTKLEANDE